MRKSIIASLGIVVFSYSFAFAATKTPPMRSTVLYNNDIRHGDENFWSNRLEAFLTKDFNFASKYEVTAKVIPFVEQRYSVDRRKRERTMTGIEFGLEPVDFLYIAEQFRYSWYSEALHRRKVIEHTNMPEALTKITLSHQLLPGKEILKGYVSGEYTYDFRNGRATRIETIIGLLSPIGKNWQANIDLRHRDRIHDFDCDTFEASVSYNF